MELGFRRALPTNCAGGAAATAGAKAVIILSLGSSGRGETWRRRRYSRAPLSPSSSHRRLATPRDARGLYVAKLYSRPRSGEKQSSPHRLAREREASSFHTFFFLSLGSFYARRRRPRCSALLRGAASCDISKSRSEEKKERSAAEDVDYARKTSVGRTPVRGSVTASARVYYTFVLSLLWCKEQSRKLGYDVSRR